MPFTKPHTRLDPPDSRTDAHNQIQADGSDARGIPYLDNADFANLMTELGWEAPWTDKDAAYVRNHSGRAGKSLIKLMVKRLTDNGLIGQGATVEPGPAPAPGPAGPPPASRPVGVSSTSFDALELAITAWGLNEPGSKDAAGAALDTLEASLNQGIKKLRNKLAIDSPWEAAVNTRRLADPFGVPSRFAGHDLQTTGFNEVEWRKFRGEAAPDTPNPPGGFHLPGTES